MFKERLVARYSGERAIFVLLLVQLVILAIPFAFGVWVSMDSCFATSVKNGTCSPSPDGVEALLGIRGGKSIQLVIFAVSFLGFGVVALQQLGNRTSELVIGMIAGASCLLSVISLGIATSTALLYSSALDFVEGDCKEISHVKCASKNVLPVYLFLIVISSALFAIHGVIGVMLFHWFDIFLDEAGVAKFEKAADI